MSFLPAFCMASRSTLISCLMAPSWLLKERLSVDRPFIRLSNMFTWSWGAQWSNNMGKKTATTNHVTLKKADCLISEKTIPFKLLNDLILDSFLTKKHRVIKALEPVRAPVGYPYTLCIMEQHALTPAISIHHKQGPPDPILVELNKICLPSGDQDGFSLLPEYVSCIGSPPSGDIVNT